MLYIGLLLLLLLVVGAATAIGLALAYRKVVPTNEVHIVQTGVATISYGKNTEAGNTYYQWPTWIPKFGVTRTILPLSVFQIDLPNYEAYDAGRLPFVVDVVAFFRVERPNDAAEKVATFEELKSQLKAIVQGAVRSVLASSPIEKIMEGRSSFGEQFTNEVREQLLVWGVVPVKNIELMDLRDARDSMVIENIMAKKKAEIEKDSRVAVAENQRIAQIAEIEAKREAELKRQEAEQQVGIRTAQKDREVGIAREKAEQDIKEQQKETRTKEMAVVKINEVTQAEITKQVEVVKAEQTKQTRILSAEAEKQTKLLHADAEKEASIAIAEGLKEAKIRESQGIQAEGVARAEAATAMALAPVKAQTELAHEIGANKAYQEYLVQIQQVQATRDIGIAQAEALKSADIKVIANAGDANSGLKNAMDLFSAKGGTQLGAMLEGLAQTEAGKAVIEKVTKA